MEISGKTAIVTGAASGIGLGIATALAEAGANVVMADIQKDALEQAAHRLSGTNKQVLPVRIDVTQEQSVIDALAEAKRRFGKLHIACNNAGVPMHGTRLVDVTPADWAFVMGVNVWVTAAAKADVVVIANAAATAKADVAAGKTAHAAPSSAAKRPAPSRAITRPRSITRT